MAADSSFVDQIREAGKNLIASTKSSLDWYKDKITDLFKKDPKKIFKPTSYPKIGQMFIFVYDPKYKATLPFYDAFPLVLPIEMYREGFLGINLHYLPPNARTSLLNALTDLKNNDKYDETTKLNISYELLSRYSSQFSGSQDCIKKYLFGHVRSSFHYIPPTEWGKVVTMPLQKWKVNPNSKYARSPPY
jgi:hypothetical protein